MSGLDQRTKARREAFAPAVSDSSSPPDARPWGDIPPQWLQPNVPDALRSVVPDFPLALLPQPWRDWASDAAPTPQGGRPALRWQVHPLLVRTTVAQTAQTAET